MRAQRREVGRALLGAQFDQRAAGEIDAEIHADEEEQQRPTTIDSIAENG